MQTLRCKSQKSIRPAHVVLIFTIAAGIRPAAAEDTLVRLGKDVATLDTLTDSSGRGIRAKEIASSDFIAVIPGFRSAPDAVRLKSGSLDVQRVGENGAFVESGAVTLIT